MVLDLGPVGWAAFPPVFQSRKAGRLFSSWPISSQVEQFGRRSTRLIGGRLDNERFAMAASPRRAGFHRSASVDFDTDSIGPADVLDDFFGIASDAPRLVARGWKPFQGTGHRLSRDDSDDEAKTPPADQRKKNNDKDTEKKKRKAELISENKLQDLRNTSMLAEMKTMVISWLTRFSHFENQKIALQIVDLAEDINRAIDNINGSGHAASNDTAVQEVGFHDLIGYLVARYEAMRLVVEPILKGDESDESVTPNETGAKSAKKARNDSHS